MKKYYLPFMCLGLLSATVLSQNTYVTGNVPVKVQPNTLFYHGGDFVVTSNVTGSQVIKNNGNIRINGNFSNVSANGTEGDNFVSLWEAEGDYGQVIINDGSTSTGMLTMEKKAINPASFAWGQFAIPFVFSTIGDAYSGLFQGEEYIGGNRYRHAIMTWDNRTRPEFDHYDASSTMINPTDYVILNLTEDTDWLTELMDDGSPELLYPGTPANGVYDITFRPAMYSTDDWSVWRQRRNYYREQYLTYIDDHVRENGESDVNYGKYIFQFGNPYTSNIDLSRIATDESNGDDVYIADLHAVTKLTGGVVWNEEDGGSTSTILKATFDGTNTWAGPAEALIVKPFEPFYITLTDDADRSDRVFHFNDGLKTFSHVPYAQSSGNLTSSKTSDNQYDSDYNGVENTTDKAIFNPYLINSTASTRNTFHQLRLNLYSENNVNLGNSVFVVVHSGSQTGVSQNLEAEYTDFHKGFFLVQENVDGTEIETPNRTMQINVVNPRYVSKPIQLFFEKGDTDISGYYLKAELFYRNIFTKLAPEDGNFVDGNSFFFYDKAQDILLPITTDFSYYIERPEENLSSRYSVYWNGGPIVDADKMNVSDEMSGLTQVYKDGDVHKIRFNQLWDSADISVYDLAGRAVFKKEGVKTDVDFVLDLPKTIVYVVKIQSNTGETVTQKILK